MLQAFVVAQVALALALLVSAGLSTRGALRLVTQYDGYDPSGVMTFTVSLPDAYPDDAARLRRARSACGSRSARRRGR